MGRGDDGKMYALNFTMGPSNVAYEIMKDTFFSLGGKFHFWNSWRFMGHPQKLGLMIFRMKPDLGIYYLFQGLQDGDLSVLLSKTTLEECHDRQRLKC